VPYISPSRREYLDPLLSRAITFAESLSPGDLNYVVTRLVSAKCARMPRYEAFNAVVGALECAKLELYRRMVAPYEDTKIAENGDVYPEAK
jgi:uncharacterized protein DUF6899